MTELTRRAALRSGVAVGFGVALAGCGGNETPTETAANDHPIPGVEDGEVVDSRALAAAHGDELATQRGTLYESRTTLETDTGVTTASSFSTTSVDGNRIHTTTAGRDARRSGEERRREYYFDEEGGLARHRRDGDWVTRELDPGSGGVSRGDLLGRTTVEIIDVTETGVESVGDRELYRFGNTGRELADGTYRRFRVQALIDEQGLVHDFQQTVDYTEEGTRETTEWFIDDLGTTVVETPVWVTETRSES